MNPLISVILPIYNVEKYLALCIESVLQQSYRKLEIILVNDGATDSSPAICEEYRKRDKRIQVVHQMNAGLASARNSGLRASHGEYLFFLDSDDCIHPKLLELAVETAETERVKLVQVELESVPADFKDYHQELPKDYKVHRFNRIQSIYNLDEDNREYGKDIRLTTTVIWSKLYHRSIFDKQDFIDGIRIHEDQMVVHRLLAAAGDMCFIELPLYYYRSNEGSLIRSKWKKDKLIILDCYKDRLNCVLELEEEKQNKQSLLDLIYRRYLICMIKNYIQVMQHMEGTERNAELRKIAARFRKERKADCGAKTKTSDRIMFAAFAAFPAVCARLYPNK